MSSYSDNTINHFHDPRNVGMIRDADGVGKVGTPSAGHFMIVYIKVSEGRIDNILFKTYGCPGAIACGSFITCEARGKTLEEASAITGKQVLAGLGGLPLGKRHNAGIAVGALQNAVKDFFSRGGPYQRSGQAVS